MYADPGPNDRAVMILYITAVGKKPHRDIAHSSCDTEIHVPMHRESI